MTHQLKRFSTKYLLISFTLLFLLSVNGCSTKISKEASTTSLIKGFLTPPASSKPGVYWYFMDGNMTKESITADLESMKKVGIGNLIFLEVNVGIPRG
ncbi:MAG: hypothetical protein H7223_02790, partial [Pedobacter sp.]|nr:hypothetical protein [Pedobacter sp.]